MNENTRRIAELIQQGKKLEAIKLLRETTGIGLREAKEHIEHLSAGTLAPVTAKGATDALDDDMLELARSGQKIEAIKLLRERTGIGLKEAKDRIDAATGETRSGCLSTVVVLLLLAIGFGAMLI